ncbi:hypothetical protein PFISCL1PPCAC_18827, partial [Pristionchus fissidentatus]
DPVVDTAIFVYTDSFMKWMIPFRIVTALAGVVIISIMLYHRKTIDCRKFVAHFNLSFLLLIHILFNLLSCLFVAIDDIYILYQQLTWKTGEDLVLPGTMFSLIVISIERSLATIFYRNYEQCPKWLGAWFGIAQILIPIVCCGIVTAYFDFSQKFSYCSVVSSSNFEVVMQISYVFLVCEMLALVFFHISLYVNWRRLRTRAVMDPTGRYQITENFRTVATLTPLIWCHFLIMVGSAIYFFSYISFNSTFDPRSYPILEESSNQIYWHGIILPLIMFVIYR